MQKKTPAAIEALLDNLRRQRGCYEKLRSLWREQLGALQSNNDSRAMGLEEEKKPFIEEVAAIENKFMERVRGLAPDELQLLEQKAKDVKNEIAGLLKEILSANEECAKILVQMHSAVREHLGNLMQGKSAAQNYGKPVWKRSSLSKNA